MDRDDWGKMLFYAFGLVEGVGFVNGPNFSAVESFAILAFLVFVLPLVIGCLIARFGLVYGFVLGIAPAIFAVSDLPPGLFGLSQVVGAIILFCACVVVAGLAGLSGQRLAVWRDAA